MSRTRAKIGRNDPCWCHSGKKYKKCHLERDGQPKKQPWEIAADVREQFRSEKYCIHALAGPTNCEGQIVRAHTIPRSAGLAAIAENGHVHGSDYDFMSLVRNNGRIVQKRIGVNEASTFTGFCGLHDNKTFEPLENEPLSASPQQCFLMGYRAACRELFLKRLHVESIKILRDLDHGHEIQRQEFVQGIADITEVGTLLGCAEIGYHKGLYDHVLVNSRWDQYHSLVLEFGVTPDILYTGGFAPESDFSGQVLQRLTSEPPLSFITVTLMPSDAGGFAVLGWEDHSDGVCRRFAESLKSLPPDDIGNALVRLGYEHIENTYARPSWWESMPTEMRGALTRRLDAGADPDVPRRADCLADDGLHYVAWPLVSSKMN